MQRNGSTISIPDEIAMQASAASQALLPAKTGSRYQKEYEDFVSWRKNKKVEGTNEEVLLAYYSNVSTKFAPNSLWSKFSMLKTCLKLNENLDISGYGRLFTLLKRNSENYKPKKAAVLNAEQVTKFLLEAPDSVFLLEKVILLFGMYGACRREELMQLTVNNIKDNGEFIMVTLEDTKNKTTRKFAITEDGTSFKGCDLFRRYLSLRPSSFLPSQRFFIDYRNGKCTRQFVGVHKIGSVPKRIATFLKLEHPETYTGHCFRRSSATILAENGGDLLTLKKFGGWKSSSVCEQYVEETESKKIKISKQLFNSSSSELEQPSTSTEIKPRSAEEFSTKTKNRYGRRRRFVISGNNNCVIKVYKK